MGKIDMPTTTFEMGNISDFVDISAGYSHSLAIDSNGKLYSWGKNTSSVELSVTGQPADTDESVLLPAQVMKFNLIKGKTGELDKEVSYDPANSSTVITRISSFRFHSIAVSKDQTVFTWGVNKLQRLGNADLKMKYSPTLYTPTQINFHTTFSKDSKTLRSIHKRVGEKDTDDDAKIMDDEDEGDEKKMKVTQIATGQMHSFVVISVKAGHTEKTNDTKIDDPKPDHPR